MSWECPPRSFPLPHSAKVSADVIAAELMILDAIPPEDSGFKLKWSYILFGASGVLAVVAASMVCMVCVLKVGKKP